MTEPALEIVYRDDHCLAVNKPAGLLVHRSALDSREVRFALQLVRDIVGRRVYPVHRLDRPTSGVLLFAFTPEIARLVAASFAGQLTVKRYLAVVRGITAEEGVIDYPLAEVRDRYLAGSQESGAKEAVTSYRRLAAAELPLPVGRYPTARYSLIEASPQSGRRHQLRRHFKHIFHPLIGDTNYGDGHHNRFSRDIFDCSRLLLHACELTVPYQPAGTKLTITAPLDASFLAIIDRLGWRAAIPPRWLPSAG